MEGGRGRREGGGGGGGRGKENWSGRREGCKKRNVGRKGRKRGGKG